MGKEFFVLLLAQLLFVNCQYGQQTQELSLDTTEQLVDPCEPNPCFNFGSCVSSDDWTGFWCYCPDNTLGDLCETLITTTTPVPTTTTTKRALIKLPIRQQQGYGQQQFFDLPTTTLAPLRPVPQGYGQQKQQLFDLPTTTPRPFRLPVPTTTLAPQPSYGNFLPQLDVVPVSGCAKNPCLNGGQCRTLETGDFTCECPEGLVGMNCERSWSNPCTEEVLRSPFIMPFEYPWNRASYIVCVGLNEWTEMPCADGTFFNSRLSQCVSDSYIEPACPQGFCLHDGECGLNTRGELTCKCRPGFSGSRCEIDIDECATNRNACSGGMCVDQINTYYCVCPSGVGLDCVNTIPEPCTSDSVEPESAYFEIISPNKDHFLHCTSLGQWVVRKCADGLFWDQEEKTCTAERPMTKTGACLTFPCKNGAYCEDVGYNQYRCVCKEGYTGAHCETMVDYCFSNPCKNGGRCLPYAGGYTCVCPGKVVDECCCNGVTNPCLSDRSTVYFPLTQPFRYIHCDADARAFVRTCPPSTRWVQSALSCLSEEIILGNATTPAPKVVLRDPVPTVQQPTYGQQQFIRKPVVQRPVQPVQPSYGQIPDLPIEQPEIMPNIARLPNQQQQRFFAPQQLVAEKPVARLPQQQFQFNNARTLVKTPVPVLPVQPVPQVVPEMPVQKPVARNQQFQQSVQVQQPVARVQQVQQFQSVSRVQPVQTLKPVQTLQPVQTLEQPMQQLPVEQQFESLNRGRFVQAPRRA